MRKARTREERMHQIASWLEAYFPPKKDTIVRWVPHIKTGEPVSERHKKSGDYGECTDEGDYFLIKVSARANTTLSMTTETLIHEWAHVYGVFSHGDKYWKAYGEIYRRYYEGDGFAESHAFPF